MRQVLHSPFSTRARLHAGRATATPGSAVVGATPARTSTCAPCATAEGTHSVTASPSRQPTTSKKEVDLTHRPHGQASLKVNVHRLRSYLRGYPSQLAQYLTSGFKDGFKIHSTIQRQSKIIITNHTSAMQNPDIVTEKLNNELFLNRIKGPFSKIPINNLIISPLGLVPKKSSGFRIIHDLSYPKDSSVNSHIDPVFARVTYEGLDHCISIINTIGRNTLMSKADLKDAFRIIPIHPEHHHLLGFMWEGQYYYDTCLPMGCSVSCQIFERLSTAIQWILTTKLNVSHMSHILDDFILFGKPSTPTCQQHLQAFLLLANSLNLPVKHEKTIQPTTCAVLHGIEVNTSTMSICLPSDKLNEAREKIANIKARKKTTLQQLQSLLGTLNFACRVVVPGRAFLRRLYDLTRGVQSRHHKIRLTCETRRDLQVWDMFLTNFNGTTMFLPNEWTSSTSIKLFTDASGHSYAAVLGAQWFNGKFPQQWHDKNIALKELLPIVLAVKVWSSLLSNKRILFMTDNQAIVHIINRQTSKDKDIMFLVRSLVLTSLSCNLHFSAKHIPGKHNKIADLLSRSQVETAHDWAPWLEENPTVVNTMWLPWSAQQQDSSKPH